jgi:hypothetical protein
MQPSTLASNADMCPYPGIAGAQWQHATEIPDNLSHSADRCRGLACCEAQIIGLAQETEFLNTYQRVSEPHQVGNP